MASEYKEVKRASVTDLQGGGMWEINFLTFLAPAAFFVWCVLQNRQGHFKPYSFASYITDFLLQCCTILFSTTVYADEPQTLTGLLLLPSIAAYLQPKVSEVKPESDPQDESTKSKDAVEKDEERDLLPVKPFITSYRGAMMIITCTSILAVDFQVFPRRFGKTEAFGTSLMDLGVGSFVFAAGLVAARQQLKEKLLNLEKPFMARMKNAFRHAIPLFGLGIIRLLTVKGLDYNEHESEYGVHWNFFFTLALLGPVVAFIQPVLRYGPPIGITAFIIAIAYELLLYMTPLKVYIIMSPRIPGNFLSENREGVFSFIGYLAIFIAGMGVGQGILPRDEDPVEDRLAAAKAAKDTMDEDADWLASVIGTAEQQRKAENPPPFNPAEALQAPWPKIAAIHLLKWTGLWFVFSVWAMWNYGPHLFVSRRMANCAYVCWVCAFNCAQLLLFCGIEMLMFPDVYKGKTKKEEKSRVKEATSAVLHAFNRNGLALFLLANLLTGAVNLTVQTWHVSDVASMAILVGYIGTIATVAVLLDLYDISIKL